MVAIRIFIPSSRWLVISLFIIFNFAANIRIISEKAKKKKENHTIFSQIRVREQVPEPSIWHVQQESIQIAESITFIERGKQTTDLSQVWTNRTSLSGAIQEPACWRLGVFPRIQMEQLA